MRGSGTNCGGAEGVLTAAVRYGPGAGLAGAAQARLAALWAGAGVPATVLTRAVQPKRPLVPLQATAIGRALAQGHRSGEGAEPGGPDLTAQGRWRRRAGLRSGVC